MARTATLDLLRRRPKRRRSINADSRAGVPGRESGLLPVAMLRHAQQVHGNRAVQRMLRHGRGPETVVQRDTGTAKKASAPGFDLGAVMASVLGHAPNAQVKAMYEAGVIAPIMEADRLAKGFGVSPEADLRKAIEKLKGAKAVNRQAREALPDDGQHAYLSARMAELGNSILQFIMQLEPLIGKLRPIPEIASLVQYEAEIAEGLGDAVAAENTGADGRLTRTLWSATVVSPLREAGAALAGQADNPTIEAMLGKVEQALTSAMSVEYSLTRGSLAAVRIGSLTDVLAGCASALRAQVPPKNPQGAKPGMNMADPRFLLVLLEVSAKEVADLLARFG